MTMNDWCDIQFNFYLKNIKVENYGCLVNIVNNFNKDDSWQLVLIH